MQVVAKIMRIVMGEMWRRWWWWMAREERPGVVMVVVVRDEGRWRREHRLSFIGHHSVITCWTCCVGYNLDASVREGNAVAPCGLSIIPRLLVPKVTPAIEVIDCIREFIVLGLLSAGES